MANFNLNGRNTATRKVRGRVGPLQGCPYPASDQRECAGPLGPELCGEALRPDTFTVNGYIFLAQRLSQYYLNHFCTKVQM